MRKILFLLLLSVSVYANAQTHEEEVFDFYIAVYYTGAHGVVTTSGIDKGTIVGDDGKPAKFQNTIEMLNFLSKKGWRYVDSTTFGGGASGFILSKKTTDENDALKSINIDKKKGTGGK